MVDYSAIPTKLFPPRKYFMVSFYSFTLNEPTSKKGTYSEVQKLSAIKLSELCKNFRNSAKTFGVFEKNDSESF